MLYEYVNINVYYIYICIYFKFNYKRSFKFAWLMDLHWLQIACICFSRFLISILNKFQINVRCELIISALTLSLFVVFCFQLPVLTTAFTSSGSSSCSTSRLAASASPARMESSPSSSIPWLCVEMRSSDFSFVAWNLY